MIQEYPVITLLETEILTTIDGFILGTSILGTDVLLDEANSFAWLPYLGDATQVSIERGARSGGIGITLDVGTLDLTLKNAGDPAVDIVKPNQRIRIRERAGDEEPVFTGRIDDTATSYVVDKQTGVRTSFTTISATDAVQTLANTRRQGAHVPSILGYESWQSRISRLASSIPSGVPYVLPGGVIPPFRLADNDEDMSLASHFDLANQSVGAHWYVDRDGIVRFIGSFSATTPLDSFVDEGTGKKYVDISTAYSSRTVINDLTITNLDGTEDGTLTHSQDETSVATWGARAADITLNLYDGIGWEGTLANRIAELRETHRNPQREVESLRWNAQEDSELAALLEVFARIRVVFDGIEQFSRILKLRHEISPTRWMVTMTLTRED